MNGKWRRGELRCSERQGRGHVDRGKINKNRKGQRGRKSKSRKSGRGKRTRKFEGNEARHKKEK